jgi:hypothetical protein
MSTQSTAVFESKTSAGLNKFHCISIQPTGMLKPGEKVQPLVGIYKYGANVRISEGIFNLNTGVKPQIPAATTSPDENHQIQAETHRSRLESTYLGVNLSVSTMYHY